MRGRTVFAVAAVVAAGLVGATEVAQAKIKVQCKPSVGMAQVDPIVAQDAPASAHLHEFFGNTALLDLPNPESADYSDLVGKGTICEIPGDTAAYWTPALMVNGKPLPAKRFIAYYRSFDSNETGQATPYPADMRLVSPNYTWSCSENSSMPEPRKTIPDCGQATGRSLLTLRVIFQQCWDGKLNDHTGSGNTTDNSHVAFRQGKVCPAGFPVKLPQLTVNVGWGDYTAGFWKGKTDVHLAGEHEGVAPGSSAHGDFWNTWVQDDLVRLVRGCINTAGPKSVCQP